MLNWDKKVHDFGTVNSQKQEVVSIAFHFDVTEVVSPLVKGDKVLVFHKKRRKGYRKLNGHRQQFTELTIKEVIA